MSPSQKLVHSLREWTIAGRPTISPRRSNSCCNCLPILTLWLALGASDFTPAAESIPPLLKVARGFIVEQVHAVSDHSQGSWISLAADSRGVLYASDQTGPLYRVELPPTGTGPVNVQPLGLPIGGVHGLCWIGPALYAIVGQRDVCQPGLYRLHDANRDGELDSLEQLAALAGDGEHGPHAVIPSPDGQSLYVLAGNGTALPKLFRSRPPPAGRGDSLLTPLPATMGSETRGWPHGGWICRTDQNARDWELVCLGLRNAYALAWNNSGELFTVDSDTEFEFGLPWYRPPRLLHCVSGADFGWHQGGRKPPEHAPDTLPAVLSLGPGSPTAVVSGKGTGFPPPYDSALFIADWCCGRIGAVRLHPAGATFTGQYEEIVLGTPLPVAAMCLNPRDRALYFVTGGRKTQSALYRLR